MASTTFFAHDAKSLTRKPTFSGGLPSEGQIARVCLRGNSGLGADLNAMRLLGQLRIIRHALNGPQPTSVDHSNAALQLHQTGLSSIPQHFRGSDVGSSGRSELSLRVNG